MSQPNRRQTLATLLAATGCGWGSNVAYAQGGAKLWPGDTLRLITPAPPGGGIDILCRQLAERLGPVLGVKVLVENRPGAGGLVCARAIAAGPAEGGTFGYLHSGLVTVQAMGGKLDLAREFVPAPGRFLAAQLAIAVAADSPHRNLADLVRYALANPGKVNYGSGGLASPGQMVVEMLRTRVPGLGMTHVPYKAALDSVHAVIAKDVDFVSGIISTVEPLVAGGRLRVLAVCGEQRSALLPQVPTLIESGYAGLSYVAWGAIFAPAKTPAPQVQAFSAAMQQVTGMADFKAYMASSGNELRAPESVEAFGTFLRTSLAAETALVSKLGLKLE